MGTAASEQRVSRPILEDRYDGLLYPSEVHRSSTKLWQRLHGALTALYEGTARREWQGALVDPDEPGTGDGTVTDELLDLIREHMVGRIDELGLAR